MYVFIVNIIYQKKSVCEFLTPSEKYQMALKIPAIPGVGNKQDHCPSRN